MRFLRIPLAFSLSLTVPATTLAQQPLAVVAPAGDEQLSERERIAKAKRLYTSAERLARRGRWAEAADRYEQAYYLVPGKHGFAYKVALAAHEAGDCDRAQDYLLHFLTYGDNDRHEGKLDEAQRLIEAIDASGCASQDSFMKVTATGQPDEQGQGDDTGKGNQPLLIGGAVLLALGGGSLVLGTVGAAMARGPRKELERLAAGSPWAPSGHHTCEADAPCTSTVEDRLKARRTVAALGFATGGVLLVGGAALLALDRLRRAESGRQEARAGGRPRITGLGPTWVPGGGGFGVTLEF